MDRKRRLMENNNGWPLRNQLFDGAPIALPLTHTVIGRGGLTPSFTRATTETCQKWDETGYLDFTALAGEMVFKGARREYNQWTTSSVSLANGANKSLTLAAGTYQFSMGAGTGTATFSGTGGATGTLAASTGRVSVAKTISAGTFVVTASVADLADLQVCNITGETDQTTIRPYVSVGALDYRSTQDPLYLSLPGTAGHYASTPDSVAASITGDIDIRVKCAATNWATGTGFIVNKLYTGGQYSYDLYLTGSGTIRFRYSPDGTGPSIVPLSSSAAVTSAPHSFTNTNAYFVRVTRSAVTGDVNFYTSGDGVTWKPLGAVQATTPSGIYNGADTLSIGDWVIATVPFDGKIFSAQIYDEIDGTTPVVDFNPHRDATTPAGTITSSTTGEVWTINGASSVVRNAAYHGSMVDGVKCYDTDRSGNPIPTTGSYPLVGYVPWEARTNLCLQSNAFTTTWTASGPPTITQNVVGPDGATSAWTLTDGTGGADHITSGNITFTAAAYTASVFIKKTVGATTFPVLWMIDAGTTTTSLCTADTNNGVATVWTANGFGLAMMAGASARCSSYNDNYWRFELTATGTAVAYNFKFGPALATTANQSSGTFSAATTGSAVFYGAQVELGSFATPYQPTTTVAVARNKDEFSETTSGAILAAGGTISLTYIPYHSPVGTIALWGTYVDASNYTAILHDATNLIFRKRIAGVNYDATIANAFTSGTTYKMAASWGSGGSTIYLNGVAGTPHANTTAAQIAATMQFGADGNSLQQPGAAVINSYIWQRQLSGSEQAAVTA